MYQDPEHEDYDDDEYNQYPNEYNEHGFPKYFKFDHDAWVLWIENTIKEIVSEGDSIWYVGYTNNVPSKTNTDKDLEQIIHNKYIYFGQNQYDEPIWKTKYFAHNKFDIFYKNHFINHAKHIVEQPYYYRSLFDLLN